MQVAILVLGTRGDLELFLALGRGLERRGHRVAIGTSSFHAERVRAAGLAFVPVGSGDREQLVATLRGLAPVPDRTRRTQLYYQRWLRPQLQVLRTQLDALAATSDYFVSNLKLVLRRGDAVMPGAAVTYDLPHAVGDLPRYTESHGERVLELVALPKALVDPDARWGARHQFTGFWHDDAPESAALPASLEAFLAAGAPPVVVTLGSMVSVDLGAFLPRLREALRLAGRRGLLVRAWAELPERWEPDGELGVVGDAAYAPLFARAACVVHHGGTGTVAAVLRAGRPSVLLPQIDCQERFADVLARCGVATGSFATDACEPRELAAAIRRAIDDPLVAAAALHWQTRVRGEAGVARACDAIESHVAALRGAVPL